MLRISNVINDHPQFRFQLSDDFYWSSSNNTIYYTTEGEHCPELLLHELSHAILKHCSFSFDIELIAIERQAWDYAKKLALSYKVEISDNFIQDQLDTYRDWIHDRSTCPKCKANGLQNTKSSYQCIACKSEWTVNDARERQLKRYIQ